MSVKSQTLLKDAVFQLINYHQNVDSLLNETSSLISTKTTEQVTKECIDVFKSCLRGQEEISDSTFHTTEACSSKILQIIYTAHPKTEKHVVGLNQTKKNELDVVLKAVKDLMKDQNFQRPRFLNVLCKQDCLPLEVLWMFDSEGVMSFEAYLSFKHSDTKFVSKMSEQLTTLCCLNSDSKDLAYRTEIINRLVELAYTDKSDVENLPLKKLSLAILDTTLRNLIDLVITSTDVVILPIYTGSLIDSDIIKKSYLHTLSVMLGHQSSVAVHQALKEQLQWTYAKSTRSLIEWNKQLLMLFSPTEVLDTISNTIDGQDVNWQLLLGFLSTFLVCESQASSLLDGFVSDVLKSGFDNSEMEKIELGFLLGRHCCLEGSHVFMSYLDWFQRLFGDSIRSPATNKKNFTLLMRFLTDTVPLDPPDILRAHILRPPFVPPKCREFLSDYVMLAKTRLSDLKQPFDNINMYEDMTDSKDRLKIMNQIEEDINKALSTFDLSGKIPTSVMEASIFRKPYFIGRFLPTLLKPRPLPDVADLKMKFIKALKGVDKIPATLYNNYKTACKQEATRLLEGVFMEIDDDIEDEMNLEPIQQLHFRIDQLIDVVLSQLKSDDNQQLKVSELVSLIREKISNFLEKSDEDTDLSHDCHVIIDPVNANLHTSHLQIVDALLNLYCKLSESCMQLENPEFNWANQLMSVISEFKILQKALYTRIWKLIMEQVPTLEPHHLVGIAVIVSLVSCNKESKMPLLEVKLCDNNHHLLRGQWTLAEQLWSCLPSHTGPWMQFSLNFATSYLQFVFSCYDGVNLTEILENSIPLQQIKKFTYLCMRLIPEVRHTYQNQSVHSVNNTAYQIYTSEKFQQSFQHAKLSLEDWINYELLVCSESDVLSHDERQEYINWCIYNKYMMISLEDGGCCHDYRIASSVLFRCIINAELRLNRLRENNTGCPKCNQMFNQSGYYNTRTTLVHILQEMSCFLSKDSHNRTSDGSCPWLLEQLQFLINQFSDDNNHIGTQAVVKAFSRLSKCLPSYLFFCDDVTCIKDQALTISCEVINNHFRCHLTHSCYLPSSITVYLLQGIISCSRHTDITGILMEAPLLLISVLIHVTQTKSFLDQLVKVTDNNITALIKVEMDWILSFDINKDFPNFQIPCWINAAALLSLTLTSSSATDVIKRIVDKGKSQTYFKEMLCIYGSLLTSHISATSPGISSEISTIGCDLENILVMVVLNCHSMLRKITSQSCGIITETVPEYIQKLRHYTILRLLCSQVPDKVLNLEDSINCLLLMLAEVTNLFDHINATSSSSNCDKTFTVQSLLEMTKYVKQCIKMVDYETLQQINREYLSSCGPEIMLVIRERFQLRR